MAYSHDATDALRFDWGNWKGVKDVITQYAQAVPLSK